MCHPIGIVIQWPQRYEKCVDQSPHLCQMFMIGSASVIVYTHNVYRRHRNLFLCIIRYYIVQWNIIFYIHIYSYIYTYSQVYIYTIYKYIYTYTYLYIYMNIFQRCIKFMRVVLGKGEHKRIYIDVYILHIVYSYIYIMICIVLNIMIYIYIDIHIYIEIHRYIYILIYKYKYIFIYLYIDKYIYIYQHMYIYLYIYTYMY